MKVDLKENIAYFRKINGRKAGAEFAMPIDNTNKRWLYPGVAIYDSYVTVSILPYEW